MTVSADLVSGSASTAHYVGSVHDKLWALIDKHQQAASSPQLRELWEATKGSIHGGKKTRPALVHLSRQAFGGAESEAAVTVGCAFELLHTGLIIHDDVIDRDSIRRGRPTLSAVYRQAAQQRGQSPAEAAHAGNSVALIAGDLLISESTRMVFSAVQEMPRAKAIMETFHQAIADAAAGELIDLDLSQKASPGGLEEVLQMHRLKTAVYSFEAPLRIGSLLAGASTEEAAQIASLGIHLGIGYQIIDDILGTFGDPQVTGKATDSDLREGKQTVLTAIASDNPEMAPSLHRWRTGQLTSTELRAELITHGVEAQARALAEKHRVASHQMLEQLQITASGRNQLHLVIDSALNRSA